MRHRNLDSNLPRRPLLRRRQAHRLVALIALLALAGCGGDDSSSQLVDGSQASDLPAELDGLGDAVMTRTRVIPPGQLNKGLFTACGHPPIPGDTIVVERTGVQGSSWTFTGQGSALHACDKIEDSINVQDPDNPGGGIWCGGATGRLDAGKLNDPRLDLCRDTDDDITAFAWVEPQKDAKWIVVSDAGSSEVYEVVESLLVRVTTTDGTTLEGASALFDIEEYAADGSQLRNYTLRTQVAG